ncbi:MAG: DUF1036 domain-containing protein [Hyphomonas sp.]|uniref:DUF1036 domain-containing protein n=1 Tax=Hyphomonas sp. TaxID=87 RepID=UPI0017FA8087|nr:DUF1036 domain-containing protein [Hyphomonas sp.]MBU3919629.1 DUF1036 domain-containing protein [Alphaproteobacteria bacterium]MBA3068402.1 DUF1036 domain-containing protein [Hyphomonas sp.]MBU4060730.1 DUF1036 domain-containing protein [Alphaproteobacteria bacterium]MBU4164714.1 DUF1036 domain-containing protein [Alphaproteobacteria bacterium]MBU4568006.1 DUF1036 domain-containing protein [Alphaproteobacteria bacterium]
MALERLFLRITALALVTVTALALPARAQEGDGAGWELCNRTSYIIETAVGHTEGTGISVDGWTKLAPGTCKIALPGPLTPGVHYLYGRGSTAHQGGGREWGGRHELCVDPTGGFSLESPPDCAAMGLEAQGFRPIDITRADSWTNNFTEIENWSLDNARNAGLQRLLDEAGIVSGTIDGNIGHRTRSAINDFLKLKDLPASTSDADLIDYLEQAAEERSRSVGFTLCNRTKSRVWSAIARRSTEGWESRGWWRIEAGGCARVIDRPLRGSEHFVYAEMEEPTGLRTLSRASEAFCVGRAKFAISGRDNCEEGSYRTALFARTPAPTERKLVYEFFERDFTPAQQDDE